MTFLRYQRLQLLRKRRADLLGLIGVFEDKPNNEQFTEVVRERLGGIEQLIADVEFLPA